MCAKPLIGACESDLQAMGRGQNSEKNNIGEGGSDKIKSNMNYEFTEDKYEAMEQKRSETAQHRNSSRLMGGSGAFSVLVESVKGSL